jgi:hypothetical protein
MAAAAFVIFSLMMAAGMAFPMMVAVGTGIGQFALQVGFHSRVRVAGSARADFYARVRKRVQGTATQAPADQGPDVPVRQQAGQGTVADAVGRDHLTGKDLSVFYFIYLKIFCSSEMLEDIAVFIGYCYFHILSSFCLLRDTLICIIPYIPDTSNHCFPERTVGKEKSRQKTDQQSVTPHTPALWNP